MNRAGLFLFLLPLAAWVPAFGAGPEAVASIDGSPIALSAFDQEFGSAVALWKKSGSRGAGAAETLKKLADETLERLIARELLCREGAKLKLEVSESDVDAALKEVGEKNFAYDETGRHRTEADAEALFLKELADQGLTYDAYRKRLARQTLAQKVLAREVKEKVALPPEKEVRAYFDKIAAYVRGGAKALPPGMDMVESLAFQDIAMQIKESGAERVRLSCILLKFPPRAGEAEKARTLSDAQALRRKLAAGAVFAQLAKEKSQDEASAPRGGDMGLVTRGKMLPEIEKAAFALSVGSVAGPIKTDLGYNLIRVTGRVAAQAPDFARAKEQLSRFIAGLDSAKVAERYVDSLKGKAAVQRDLSLVAARVSAAVATLKPR